MVSGVGSLAVVVDCDEDEVEVEVEVADAAVDDVVPIEPNQAITLNASRKAATAAIATRRRISRTLTA